MSAILRSGNLTMTRAVALSKSLPSTDVANTVPSDLTTVRFVFYWGKLRPTIYASSAVPSGGLVTVALPVAYCNPVREDLMLDLYWVRAGTILEKFAEYTVTILDQPSTAESAAEVNAAPYPVLFYKEGLASADAWLGPFVFPCPTGGGTFRRLIFYGTTMPTGASAIITLYAAGVATATTYTLVAGATEPVVETISVAATAGVQYRFKITQVGSTYPGEGLYAALDFYPTA